jgi:hypothetical protein
MTFPRVRPGQRLNQNLPATAVNGLFGLLDGAGAKHPRPPAAGNAGSDPVGIMLKNNTGAPLASSFSVVAVGNAVITRTDGQAAFERDHIFEGNTPTTTATVAIVQEPLSADAIGRGVIAGVTVAKLNVVDAAHTHAGPTTSTTELTTSTSGLARILWKEAGTGTRWGKVLLTQSATYTPPAFEYEQFVLKNTLSFTSVNTYVELTNYQTTGADRTYIQFPSTGIWQIDINLCTSLLASVTPSSGIVIVNGWLYLRAKAVTGDSALLAPNDASGYEANMYLNRVDNGSGQSGSVRGDLVYADVASPSMSLLLQVNTANTKALALHAINAVTITDPTVLYTSFVQKNESVNGISFAPLSWIVATKVSEL